MKKKLKLLLSILMFGIISSSCTTTHKIPVAVEPVLPPPLELPKIPREELQCLTDKTYSDLVTITRLLKERNKTLRALLKQDSNHE